MKLLSNFDTDLDEKIYQEQISLYGEDKMMMIYRDKAFFVFFILIPIILVVILYIILLWFCIEADLWDETLNGLKWLIWLLLMVIGIFYFGWKILKKFIDYRMDFAIVNPKEVLSYNQTWLFTRTARTIDSKKIKTITVDKKWIINSIFNLWTIKFLSEWDSWWNGDIELYFVYDPDSVKSKLKWIISLWESSWE